mmetsp:Transcript_8396/g.18412  ORF Transcript_8396/g.18412 Transcript_8396/m.18412 type:complete len:254 (-) Transcript_8396:522-1283(-)
MRCRRAGTATGIGPSGYGRRRRNDGGRKEPRGQGTEGQEVWRWAQTVFWQREHGAGYGDREEPRNKSRQGDRESFCRRRGERHDPRKRERERRVSYFGDFFHHVEFRFTEKKWPSRRTAPPTMAQLRHPAHLPSGQREPHGASPYGLHSQPSIGQTHHGRHPVLRIRPPGSEDAGTRTHLCRRRRAPSGGHGHRSRHRRRPSLRPDPGILRPSRSGGQPGRRNRRHQLLRRQGPVQPRHRQSGRRRRLSRQEI